MRPFELSIVVRFSVMAATVCDISVFGIRGLFHIHGPWPHSSILESLVPSYVHGGAVYHAAQRDPFQMAL